MRPYIERSARLTLDSSVAVMVLMGSPDDVEFLPLKPSMADEGTIAELKARWPGRGLRSVGIIGLVGTTPRCALKEPLDSEQVTGLADAFLAYLHSLYCDGFRAQTEAAEIAELERLYSLPDTRIN